MENLENELPVFSEGESVKEASVMEEIPHSAGLLFHDFHRKKLFTGLAGQKIQPR